MVNTDHLAALKELSCTDLSDAMDRLGIACQAFEIKPFNVSFSLVGQAWTLRYGSVGQSGGSVGDYIDDLGPGQVVVLDNRGRMDATVWGDLLTMTASRRHVAGTVIDGICRDIDRALELQYPIFARGNWMRTGKDRVRVEAVQESVTIGGVRVEPGDWLRGDGDGLVVVPAGRLSQVLDVAREVHQAEQRIRQAILQGSTLRQARLDNGYHQLQTKRS
jgi:regulator of RNase E activity RraA